MRRKVVFLICLWVLTPVADAATAPETDDKQAEAPAGGNHKQFGGPNSVGAQLEKDDEVRDTVIRDTGLRRGLAPYYDFKTGLKEKHGLSLGIDYNALYQGASASIGKDAAAGGAIRLFGSWTAVGRETENPGSLVFKFENRHRLGTDIAPQDLASEIGYAGLTAVVFSDERWALTNLYWQQTFLDGGLAFIAGAVDTTDYVATYSLVNPWTDFSNLAFLTDPTVPVPNQGLGAAVRAMLPHNLYILGGIADANSDPTDPLDMFDSFFGTAEFFTHVEFGWIPSFAQKFTDNAHATVWHADAREKAGVPNGWGVALSFNRLIAEKWEPFVRAGYADDGGALWDRSVSVGFGRHIGQKSQFLGVGLSWGSPSDSTFAPGLRDQYTIEVYYRLHLLKILTITPDFQLLVDPAQNPNEDLIAVFGLRARVNF